MELSAFAGVRTPAYIIDKRRLTENLKLLKKVQDESGCKVLLAQKCFSVFYFYPLIGQYLAGTTASGLYEARLGKEEMGRENHVFAPAYRDSDMAELASICDHVVFNSLAQYARHKEVCLGGGASLGLRVNPECSTQEHALYDPCGEKSRLGVLRGDLGDRLPDGIEGLHFHTLCEQGAEDLVTTFRAFEDKFASFLPRLKWLNLGGGHHITKSGYNLPLLLDLLGYVKEKYGLTVYLEPGEAVALDAGYLLTEVMDVVRNGCDILILDASAACHMPDVLEMPYRPPLRGSAPAGVKPYSYRLSSLTCLAGDVIGDYSFDAPVKVGDRLLFEDMAIYTMVKNNTFNGIPLPDILVLNEDGTLDTVRRFGYEDFKGRLS